MWAPGGFPLMGSFKGDTGLYQGYVALHWEYFRLGFSMEDRPCGTSRVKVSKRMAFIISPQKGNMGHYLKWFQLDFLWAASMGP